MELRLSAGDFAFERTSQLRDTYKIGPKIGEGAFSSVRVIKHRETKEKRAVKTIHKKSIKTEEDRQGVFTEVSILQHLDHPHILQLHEFYQDSKNYYIITEYCAGGELFDAIINMGSFSEATAAEYMKQLLGTVFFLHKRNIVHRDLKPENILLSNDGANPHIKVVDFGSAQEFTPGIKMTKKLGTPYYIAPEVLRKNYNELCDIWSCGVNMYILLCGYPPFGGDNDQEIIQRVKVGRFSFPSPEWDNISFEAKDLIERMLTFDPARRISAKDALNHPWLSNASSLPLNRQVVTQMLNNLKNFKAEQQLKRAALAFIGSHLSTHAEREAMVEVFQSFDTDLSGTLSFEELKEGYSKVFGGSFEDIDSEVKRIMKEVDIDQSGEIDYSEFVTATMSQQQLTSTKKLECAFKLFDLDGSGSISAQELKEVLGKHQEYDERIWGNLIEEADLNGDGEIDLQEFTKLMRREG